MDQINSFINSKLNDFENMVGGAAKNVGSFINNDIAKPIQQNVVQPIQQGIQNWAIQNPQQSMQAPTSIPQQLGNTLNPIKSLTIPSQAASFLGQKVFSPLGEQQYQNDQGQYLPGQEPSLARYGANFAQNVMGAGVGVLPMEAPHGFSLPKGIGTAAGMGLLQKLGGASNSEIFNPTNIGTNVLMGGMKFGDLPNPKGLADQITEPHKIRAVSEGILKQDPRLNYDDSYVRAFNLDQPTEKELIPAIATIKQGKLDNPIANQTINSITSNSLPQFKYDTAPDQARMWDYILGRKYGFAPEEVPYKLRELDKSLTDYAGRIVGQAGFAKIPDISEKNPPNQGGDLRTQRGFTNVKQIDNPLLLGKDWQTKQNEIAGQGEKTITPEQIGKYGQDIKSPQGQAQIGTEIGKATTNKNDLDRLFQNVAQDTNTKFDISRVKQPDIAGNKIILKRSQGRDYNIDDLNDFYGARIQVSDPKQTQSVVNDVKELEKQGIFKINKVEDVSKDTYHATHVDFQLSNGLKGELQIQTPQEAVESLVNHEIRSVAGENPPQPIKQLKVANAEKAEEMTNPQASQAVENLEAQKGLKPQLRATYNAMGEPLPWEKPTNLAPSDLKQLSEAPVNKTPFGGRGGDSLIKQLTPNYKPADRDIQNLLREKRGRFDLERDQSMRESAPLQDFWNKQSKTDRLAFMQRIQEGLPQPTPELQALAEKYRARFDHTYEIAAAVDPSIHYKEDYFTKNGLWASPEKASQFYQQWQQRLAATPGSFKRSFFPTILDGVQAGLELKETNPETLYLNNYVQVTKAKMASDFMKEARINGWDMNKVQGVIDKYMDPSFGGQGWYKSLRQVNNTLNSIDLSLSGFHVLGTAINASVTKAGIGLNQLLRGDIPEGLGSIIRIPSASLEYVMRGNKIMKEAEAGNITPDIQNITDSGNRISPQKFYQGSGLQQAVKSTMDDINNGKIVSATLKAPFRALGGIINEVSKPIMEWWVPRLKNGALADLIETNLKSLPENTPDTQIREVKALASDSIDNRFGQLVQDNLFWNKSLKQMLGLVMRSPGWNIGTVRELGLGARDLTDVRSLLQGKGLSDRAAYTITLPIIVGLMGAAYQYLHTGKGPEQLTDYFYPKTGAVDPKTGKEERVSLPTYMKDIFAFFHDPIQTAFNKASPLLSDVMEQAKGVDYFGKPIYDPNAPLTTQLQQRGAQEIVKHVPFSVSSGIRRLQVTPETTAESLMGINKAPASIMGGYYDQKADLDKTLSPDQKKIADMITLSASKGGPSAAEKAKIMIDNPWTINYMKSIQLAANPKDIFWSMPNDKIQAYLAYQATSDPKIKAQLRVLNPWIPQFQQQYFQQIQQGVASTKQAQLQQQNSVMGKLGSALGVYNPAPVRPITDFAERPPTPMSKLTPDQVKIASLYTSLPQGSQERRDLLAKNPWLVDYWNKNSAYYQQNPVQQTGPLADYLRSQGINPNVLSGTSSGTSGSSGFGGSIPYGMKSKAAYFKRQALRKLKRKVPSFGKISKATPSKIRLTASAPSINVPKLSKLRLKQPKIAKGRISVPKYKFKRSSFA